jgi:hypothetical protein
VFNILRDDLGLRNDATKLNYEDHHRDEADQGDRDDVPEHRVAGVLVVEDVKALTLRLPWNCTTAERSSSRPPSVRPSSSRAAAGVQSAVHNQRGKELSGAIGVFRWPFSSRNRHQRAEPIYGSQRLRR